MTIEEEIANISCKPKKMKEQLFQYGFESNNLKSTIRLMQEMIDKCEVGNETTGKKAKRSGPKRPPSAYNNFISECFIRHKGDADYGFKPTGVKCRAEWKAKKG